MMLEWSRLGTWMKAACLSVLGMTTVLMCGAAEAQAQDICQESDIAGACADPTGYTCLETLHACGRSEVILTTFTAELKGTTPMQKYFMALAYVARANQVGSMGLRCDAIAEARDMLDSYLYAVQDNYRRLKTYGSESDMKATYHASRLREQLKGETGCLESAHTIASLRRWVRETAAQRIQDLFFGLKGDDGLDDTLTSVWSTLQSAMNEFVTRAAETESVVQKIRAKTDTARDTMTGPGGTLEHMNNIAKATVTSSGAIEVDLGPLNTKKTWVETSIAAPINVEVANFKQATDNMTPEDFGKARDEVSSQARGMLGSLSWGTNHLTEGYLATNSDFALARSAIFSNTSGAANPVNTLYSIHGAWNQYGTRPSNNRCALAVKPWYCLVAPAGN